MGQATHKKSVYLVRQQKPYGKCFKQLLVAKKPPLWLEPMKSNLLQIEGIFR